MFLQTEVLNLKPKAELLEYIKRKYREGSSIKMGG